VLLAGLLTTSLNALAQGEPAAAAPAPPSTMARHLNLALGAAWGTHAGSLASSAGYDRNVGQSLSLQGQLAWGLSRHVAVGLAVDWDSFAGADNCGDCSASAVAVGPMVQYHLVQGTRFDPWLAAGVAWRSLEVRGAPDAGTYGGYDWLRLQLGGDWYATSLFGLGPYLGMNLSRFPSRPDGAGSAATAWSFLTGFRVVLDTPGK